MSKRSNEHKQMPTPANRTAVPSTFETTATSCVAARDAAGLPSAATGTCAHDKWFRYGKHVLTFIAGSTSTGLAAYLYMQTMIERTVLARMAPYEATAAGLNLNQSGDWNAAVLLLREALRKGDKANTSGEALGMMCDGLLLAISNSDSPSEFEPEVRKIRDRLGRDVATSPSRSQSLGWYFLRTGNVAEAEYYFRHALQLYDARREWGQAADPAKGLMFVALAKGDATKAMAEFDVAHERRPSDIAASKMESEANTWSHERWFDECKAFYGSPFEAAVSTFISKLHAVSREAESGKP